MINGNSQEFIDGLYYGDERFFVYCKKKYFIQGYCENEDYVLEIYIIEPSDNKFHWKGAFKKVCVNSIKNILLDNNANKDKCKNLKKIRRILL